jgi:predicted CopG family antitoxin
MGSTTISLKDKAYERLKSLKGKNESFSDVVIELTEEENENFENIVGDGIDITAEELIKLRREEDFIRI